MESPFRDLLFQEAKESYYLDKDYNQNDAELLMDANHIERRLAPILLNNDINRVEDMYFIYNPRNYEAACKQLQEIEKKEVSCRPEICNTNIFCVGGRCSKGSYLKRIRLQVMYEGLKRCIDPESKGKIFL